MLENLKLLVNAWFARNPERRYAARHTIVSGLARRNGFRLYNRNLYWLTHQLSFDDWKEFEPDARYITDRRFVLHSIVKSLANIPGDTVECGVFYGGSSFLICKAVQESVRTRTHHIFDSFEGLSEPTSRDVRQDETAYHWNANDLSVAEDIVRQNLSRFEFIRYYKGWIPERFSEISTRKFSFVHIDVDLYQPTLDSLAFFYDRMVPGGMILCDDYGSTICPGAFDAMNEFFASKPESCPIHLPTGQGLVVKCCEPRRD